MDITQAQSPGAQPSYVHLGRIVRTVIHVDDFETVVNAQTISNVIFVYSAVVSSTV
jgi:hypothetical protein